MKIIKRYTLLLLITMFITDVAATRTNNRVDGLRVYYSIGGVCTDMGVCPGFWLVGIKQATLTDDAGNTFLVWANANCNLPAYFKPRNPPN